MEELLRFHEWAEDNKPPLLPFEWWWWFCKLAEQKMCNPIDS